MTQRALDHLVLPTASVDAARARLTRLGFTVAPTGVHPFGTVNACVYLPGGTFLEMLAVGDGKAAADAIAHGNVFVARDHVFRAIRGQEGFSAIVLASGDADADHAAFAKADISGGDMLTFSRPTTDGLGNTDTATFKLAFAADIETADAFLFTCQRINTPSIDRGALERHANGVTGIATILVGEHAGSFIRLIERAVNGTGHDTTHAVTLAGTELRMLRPSDPPGIAEGSETLAAIVFDVPDIELTRAALDAGHVRHHATEAGIVVPAAAGQGATFIFRRPN
jgi:hypothetical protein